MKFASLIAATALIGSTEVSHHKIWDKHVNWTIDKQLVNKLNIRLLFYFNLQGHIAEDLAVLAIQKHNADKIKMNEKESFLGEVASLTMQQNQKKKSPFMAEVASLTMQQNQKKENSFMTEMAVLAI